MKNVAMYLRKSRADIAAEAMGEAETLARHERLLREYAASAGLTILHTYKEVVSGDTIEARPQIQALLDDVLDKKYSAILVVDIDRLGRGNMQDQGYIYEVLHSSKCFVITPTKTYDPDNEDDMVGFELGMFMSRLEYRLIKKRLQRGLIAAVKEGQWLSHPPYGYDICFLDGPRKQRSLKPNPETAPIVKRIFELSARGLSLEAIRDDLWERGIRTQKGNEYWNRGTIGSILCNEAYLGKTYRSKIIRKYSQKNNKTISKTTCNTDYLIADGLHEALVSEELWLSAQKSKHQNAPVRRKHRFLNPYAGLLVCSKCGASFRRADSKGNSKARVVHQSTIRATPTDCRMPGVPTDILDEKIIDTLKQDLANFEVQVKDDNCLNAAKEQQGKTVAMKKEIEVSRSGIDKIYTLFEHGVIGEEKLTERTTKLEAKIEELTKRLNEIEKIDVLKTTVEQTVSLHQAIDMLGDTSISAKDKNDFLKTFIDRIEYTKKPGSQREYDKSLKLKIKYKDNRD